MQKVCIDLGYGYTKGLADNGRSVVFPSIVGAGYSRDMAALFGEKQEISAENLHVRIIDEQGAENEYFIGELARKESRTASYAFDDNKTSHPNTRALLATAAAMLTDSGKETLLVTGLPLEYFHQQKGEFERFLRRFRADITLYGAGTQVRRAVMFDQVLVYPQAAGATYDVLSKNPHILKQKGALVGVIDIGHKTTDYIAFEVSDRLSVMQSLSGTIKAGVSVLHSYLEQEYYRKTGIHLKQIDAEKLILGGGKKLIYGEEEDFSPSIRDGTNELARLIRDTILNRWDHRLEDFPAIYLAGGGARLLCGQLLSLHRNVKVVEDAQLANVKGFMHVAELFCKKTLKAV